MCFGWRLRWRDGDGGDGMFLPTSNQARVILCEFVFGLALFALRGGWFRGCCGLWTVGCGLWAVGCGLWAVGCGLWAVGCGLWAVGCGLWVSGDGGELLWR
jgi:hypothetical protein